MRLRSAFIALVIGAGLAAGACGDDNPSIASDATGGSDSGGSDGSGSGATLTSFVIDLVQNHSTDPTPAAFASFSALPDPDGDNNNTHAYDPLFP